MTHHTALPIAGHAGPRENHPSITVETRKREEINGAWSPDARWRQGAGADPLPRYFIER